jgi:hypothetical protein
MCNFVWACMPWLMPPILMPTSFLPPCLLHSHHYPPRAEKWRVHSHGRSGHPHLCPAIVAMASSDKMLCVQGTTPETSHSQCHLQLRGCRVPTPHHHSCFTCYALPSVSALLSTPPGQHSCGYFHSLLCAWVDSDCICLIGR